MWFETTTDEGGYLTSFANPTLSDDDHQVWMTDSGQIGVGDEGTKGLSNVSTQSYNDGNWHYVVAVASSKTISLYVDGQLVAEGRSTSKDSFTGSWLVGNGTSSNSENAPSSNYFAGTISDVAFSDTALGSSLIMSQYEASPASS
jgi:hypothetical protein